METEIEALSDRLKAGYGRDREKVNVGFVLLAVICVFYLINGSKWLIFLACFVFVAIIILAKMQKKKWRDIFYEKNRKFSDQFWQWHESNINRRGISGCGYIVRDGRLCNVLWILNGEEFSIYEMPFTAYFVKSIENVFWFLFSMNSQESKALYHGGIKELEFLTLFESHQDFLRKRAIEENQVLIMQSFMYAYFYRQIQTGKLCGNISMNDRIDGLRKEKISGAELRNGWMFYIAEWKESEWEVTE